MTPILAFSGPSGSGKTRLLLRLLPALRRRGLRVAALKHSGHRHSFDRPGKDSDRLRRAGAEAVALAGPSDVAYFGPAVGGARATARLLPPADLVVAEGFTGERLPRIELHRRTVSREFLCASDRSVVALVGDEPPPRPIPFFGPDEVEAIADFVCRRFLGKVGSPGRRAWRRGGADPHALAVAHLHAHPSCDEAGERLSEENEMPRTMSKNPRRKTSSGRSSKGMGSQAGGKRTTVREAGRKGGRRTLKSRGPAFYSEIGRKGGRTRASSGGKKGGRAKPAKRG